MPSPTNIATFDISLHLTKILTKKVNECWESGELMQHATPTTQKLLSFWLDDEFCNNRQVNFHLGQKQAILNIIYLHEFLKVKSVKDIYLKFDAEIKASVLKASIETSIRENTGKTSDELLIELENQNYSNFQEEIELYEDFKADILTQNKYSFIKYALKLATATGKTWVMNAIIIWQYLNAKADPQNHRYTHNFMIIAPGVIVYERLIESLRGKNGDSSTSDILQNKALFVPDEFIGSISNFLQTGVLDKNNVGNISNGCIIVVNWHIFLDTTQEQIEPENITEIINHILPLKPGKNNGNDLKVLDKTNVNLVDLITDNLTSGLMVINDEAHHIHENKINGKVESVKWQQAIDNLQNKIKNFTQIDFTATPYITTGSGDTRKKHYFPHIIVDFDLRNALTNGLVKMVVMDKSTELEKDEYLDFKAQTDKNGDLILSEGQKAMIQIGLGVLAKNQQYLIDNGYANKHPKMMITCEDTAVVGLVEDYLQNEQNLSNDEFFAIHSKKKDEISEKEYQKLKGRLFNLNNDAKTKVIVSVLMLKEGFDTNNICVIVPLRSTTSSILLEQTIGRGLRLMFRTEPNYDEATKRRVENYDNAANQKLPLVSHLDILHIVEHPAFYEEYKKLMEGGEVVEPIGSGGETREMQVISLKENYQQYDMVFIDIKHKHPKPITSINIDITQLKEYEKSLADLMSKIDKRVDIVSKEILSENIVDASSVGNIKTKIESYQVALMDLTTKILTETIGSKKYPILQHLKADITTYLDKYIRGKLFGREFNPKDSQNWKVLYILDDNIKDHIRNEFKSAIEKQLKKSHETTMEVNKSYFSSASEFNWIARYCLKLQKTIYDWTPYPSYGGGFEKDFLELLDKDNTVLKFVKVLEFKHLFARIPYINSKNMLQNYYPDFLVETKDGIYIVETKSEKDLDNATVLAKKKATNEYVNQINKLDKGDRGGKKWRYNIISDSQRKHIKDKSISFGQLIK